MTLRPIKLVSTALVMLASFTSSFGQSQAPVGHPFENGEELVLVAEFSRGPLKKIDVAEFRFAAAKQPAVQKILARESHHETARTPYTLRLTGEVSSKGFFVRLFNLRFREWMESIVDPTSFTVQKTKRIDEQGKRFRVSEAVYANGKVSWVERDPNNPTQSPRTANASFSGQVQDVLSAIYFLRTMPLAVGKSFEVTISDSGEVYNVPVRITQKKMMKTILGRVEAIRVDPQLFSPEGLIERKGHISIWFTNDQRRIPVKAKINTEIGTFDVTLRKVIQKPARHEHVTQTNTLD